MILKPCVVSITTICKVAVRYPFSEQAMYHTSPASALDMTLGAVLLNLFVPVKVYGGW